MAGRVIGALICGGVMLFGILVAAVLLFRVACALAGVPKPSAGKSVGIVVITFVVLTVCEAILAAVVRAVYLKIDYPLWEAGVVGFCLGLPLDLAVASAIHAGLLRVKFGKAVEVWFAHRLILLSLLLTLAGGTAVVWLAFNA